MDANYIKIIEDLAAELLSKYNDHLKSSKDEYTYCAIVTGSLVFKELILTDFKKSILRDSEDNPDDISFIIEEKAKEIAESIRNRCLCSQQSLN